MRWKKVPTLLLACLLLVCTGCFDSDLDDYEDIYYIPDSSLVVDENPPLPGEVIAYKYPADQAQALRDPNAPSGLRMHPPSENRAISDVGVQIVVPCHIERRLKI